jgi:hypothetical protein
MIRSPRSGLLRILAAIAAGVMPAAGADALPCADYISTSIDDEPGVYQLVGTETRTETISYTIQATPGGVGSGTTVTKTSTYEVGTYSAGGDQNVEIDCRDYTEIRD